MKVKVVFDVDDGMRRSLGWRHGKRSASREDIVNFISGMVRASMETVQSEFREELERINRKGKRP